jgi:tRNA threonylcarbamoyladenosine biosynthesis protein TsaB
VNNILFITFHSTYTTIILGLFRDNQLIDCTIEDHKKASKTLPGHLQELLSRQNIQLSDCAFIAAHTGPGPFTTLRVLISFVDGLAYASKLPLVGVDGLITFIEEYHTAQGTTIALLNAFCDDVYYAIRSSKTPTTLVGVTSITQFLNDIVPIYSTPSEIITFIGNGTTLHQDIISRSLKQPYMFAAPIPETCSLNAIAQAALNQWHDKKNITEHLLPTYLKSYSATMNVAPKS